MAAKVLSTLVGALLPLRPPLMNIMALSWVRTSGTATRTQCCQTGRSTSLASRQVWEFMVYT